VDKVLFTIKKIPTYYSNKQNGTLVAFFVCFLFYRLNFSGDWNFWHKCSNYSRILALFVAFDLQEGLALLISSIQALLELVEAVCTG